MLKLRWGCLIAVVLVLLVCAGILVYITSGPTIRDNLLQFAQLPPDSTAQAEDVRNALLKLVPIGTPVLDVQQFIVQSGRVFGRYAPAKRQGSFIACSRGEENPRSIICFIDGGRMSERLQHIGCSVADGVYFYFDRDDKLTN